MSYPIFYRIKNTNTVVKMSAPNSREVIKVEGGDAIVVNETYHTEKNINRCIDEYDASRNNGMIQPISEMDYKLMMSRVNMIRGNAVPVGNIKAQA